MGRSLRPWWYALIVSLMLHALLIGGALRLAPEGIAPAPSIALEVQLLPPTTPRVTQSARPPPSPPSPPRARAAPPEQAGAAVEPAAGESTVADSTRIEPAAAQPGTESAPRLADSGPPPIEPAEPSSQVAAADSPQAPLADSQVAAAPALPPLNPLPARVDLRFKVRYGMAAGEQTLVWVNESGARYTVISVAEATGLAGLLYRGKFVQTSRGRMTPLGLQPEEFWDQRGDRRSSAQFDAEQGHLTLNPAQGAPRHFSYQGEVQDVLSLFFQLALTAPPGADTLSYTVFNGRKLRDYRYEVRGITRLETVAGPLRTLHLARVADGDGRFEVWLAVDRHYLPVRVLKSDDNDNAVELTLLSMAY